MKKNNYKSWFKVAQTLLEKIDSCPKMVVSQTLKSLVEDKDNQMINFNAHYICDYLQPQTEFIESLVKIMRWTNIATEKTYRGINKEIEINPEEVILIKKGMEYIDTEVKPFLNEIVSNTYLHTHLNSRSNIRSLIYSIMSTKLTQQNIKNLEEIAKVPFRRKAREANQIKLMQALSNNIYNISNKTEHSTIVVRELLQNAVDACVKKKKLEPDSNPYVKIDIVNSSLKDKITSGNEELELCDIVCYDTGVGMTWETVKEKFFVLYESGKESDPEATGGFGLAKAAIQNTPIHGWGLETNGISTSRAGRYSYYSSDEDYIPHNLHEEHPIMKSSGTQVSLFGMPRPDEWKLRDYLSRYTIGSEIPIYFNEYRIQPMYEIDEFKPLSSSLSGIVNDATALHEEEIRNAIRMDMRFDLRDNEDDENNPLREQGFYAGYKNYEYENGKYVNIRILNKPIKAHDSTKYIPGAYPIIMLNGQFQYEDKTYVTGLAVIVDVKTNIRPNTPHYPVTQGRDSLIQEFNSSVASVLNQIQTVCKQIAESGVLKQGTITNILNKNLPGLSLSNVENQSDEFDFKIGALFDRLSGNERSVEDILQFLSSLKVSGVQQENNEINELINTLYKIDRSRFITRDLLEELYVQAGTPTAISVERGFMSSDLINRDKKIWLTSNLLWSFTLKELMISMAGFVTRMDPRAKNQSLIPGIIISKEALGLYVPEIREKQQPPQVLVNPLLFCNILYPELSAKASGGSEISREEFKQKDPSHIEQLAIELFNTGIHELTHFYFPDSGGHSRFHSHITSCQNRCHKKFPVIHNKVYSLLPYLVEDCFHMLKIMTDNHASLASRA